MLLRLLSALRSKRVILGVLLVLLLNSFLLAFLLTDDTSRDTKGKVERTNHIDLTGTTKGIKVGTYNIWNFMFHWELRMQFIASLVRSPHCYPSWRSDVQNR